MNIWDSWAGWYRNARALSAAVALFVAIFTMQILRCNPVVSRENIFGQVVTVEAEGLHPFGDGEPLSRVLVLTPDSLEVRIMLPPPVPMVGNAIPLIAEHYKKGDTLYIPDQLKWRMDGPGPGR